MKIFSSLATLSCLASLVGCAALPEDVDSVSQSALVDPTPGTTPTLSTDPCLVDPADSTFAVPAPLTTGLWTRTETGTSIVAGRFACDHHTVEFTHTNTLRHSLGFRTVHLNASDYPGMTQADCEATKFTGWISGYYPPPTRGPGTWDSLATLTAPHSGSPSERASWSMDTDGGHCTLQLPGGFLHYLITDGISAGFTRVRMGGRLDVRHGGVWTHGPVETIALFMPPTP